MAIRTRQDFDKTFRADWSDGDELRLSLSILEFLATHPETTHIPYSRLHELARDAALRDPLVVERVIQYLTGAQGRLLDLGAELVDEHDDVYRLEDDDLKLAMLGINPITGDPDDALGRKLLVYFCPSPLAQEVLWGAHEQ